MACCARYSGGRPPAQIIANILCGTNTGAHRHQAALHQESRWPAAAGESVESQCTLFDPAVAAAVTVVVAVVVSCFVHVIDGLQLQALANSTAQQMDGCVMCRAGWIESDCDFTHCRWRLAGSYSEGNEYTNMMSEAASTTTTTLDVGFLRSARRTQPPVATGGWRRA